MRRWLAAILFNTACASSGDLVEADVIVPREGAKALSAKFRMAAGDLTIHGGDCELAQAKMRYESTSMVPNVDFAIDDQGFGTLIIREEKRGDGRSGEWNVCLTRDLPLELAIDLGAGDSRIELTGVQLRTLDVDVGAGSVAVDLKDSILAASTVKIAGGAGDLSVALPTDVGVRVHAKKGAGQFAFGSVGLRWDGDVLVNDLWGKSDRSVDVRISLGAGQITLTHE